MALEDDVYDAYSAVTPDTMATRGALKPQMSTIAKNVRTRSPFALNSVTPASVILAGALPWTGDNAVAKAALYGTGALNMFSGLSDIGTVVDSLYNTYKSMADYDYKNDKEYQDGNYRYAAGGTGGF